MKKLFSSIILFSLFLSAFSQSVGTVLSEDETCGNDGQLTIYVLNCTEDFEYTYDNGISWFPASCEGSPTDVTVNGLSTGDYYVKIRTQDMTVIPYGANPVNVGLNLNPPAPEILGVSASYYAYDCETEDASILINSQNASEFSIDGGTTWQDSHTFMVGAGEYPHNLIMARNACGDQCQYNTPGTIEVKDRLYDLIVNEGYSLGNDYTYDIQIHWTDPSCEICSDGEININTYPDTPPDTYMWDLYWRANDSYSTDMSGFIYDQPNGIYNLTFIRGNCEYTHPTTFVLGEDEAIYIPDENFRGFLVNNTNINTNGDTLIQRSEALSYHGSLQIFNYNIYDLTGIEEFIFITELHCQTNHITSVDLSANTSLTDINLSNNELEELIILDHIPAFVNTENNPSLFCAQVQDASFAENNWDYDTGLTFTTEVCLSNNANLSEILIDGTILTGFSAELLSYSFDHPYCTELPSNISATAQNENANISITLPDSDNNYTASISVMAEDGISNQNYTIQYILSETINITDVVQISPECPGDSGGFEILATGGNGILENGIHYSYWNDISQQNEISNSWQTANPVYGLSTGNYLIQVRDMDGCTETYNSGDSISLDELEFYINATTTDESTAGMNDGTITVDAYVEGQTGFDEYSLLYWDEELDSWEYFIGHAGQISNDFTSVPAGSYRVEVISLPNYCSIISDETYTIFEGGNATYNVELNITDGVSPVPDAEIFLNGTTLNTNASGQATFNDIENGNYPYTVNADGYEEYASSCIVNGENVTINIELTEIPETYTVTFNVSDGSNPIEGANIEVNSQTHTTDITGQISVSGLPTAFYEYSVIATNYEEETGSFEITDEDVILNITLTLINVNIDGQINKDFNVYPNPATTNIFISGSNETYELKIIDTQGRVIHTDYISGTETLDISTWVPGMYFINLKTKQFNKRIKLLKM